MEDSARERMFPKYVANIGYSNGAEVDNEILNLMITLSGYYNKCLTYISLVGDYT
ncbi:hypothetical protein GCM10007415_05020 [Parapedobacter pyrenivorans]|uniref:Uncharacterized protein n=1 Tax=Parapedobacter pyrenivorans TaxID=1305674 RepID=A0A917M5F5_9SPHI|nr:hypothetical protein GCM10007415_05020 [Parapedobacter pyrenivorans]